MSAPTGNQFAADNAGGRPSKYKSEYNEQAYKLCLLGHTDAELGTFFGVDERTINNWKQEHEEFFQSIKKGKEIADGDVASSLYQRAIGYSHPDTHFSSYEGQVTATPTTKHYPPDTAAAIFWLKNRQRAKWRDNVDLNVNSEKGAALKAWTADDVLAYEAWQQQQQQKGGDDVSD